MTFLSSHKHVLLFSTSGAVHVVIGGSLYWLWLSLSIGAAVFYMLVCFKAKPDTQITVAGYMSTGYAILMLAVSVGIVVQTAQVGNRLHDLNSIEYFLSHTQRLLLCRIPGPVPMPCSSWSSLGSSSLLDFFTQRSS